MGKIGGLGSLHRIGNIGTLAWIGTLGFRVVGNSEIQNFFPAGKGQRDKPRQINLSLLT